VVKHKCACYYFGYDSINWVLWMDSVAPALSLTVAFVIPLLLGLFA
jgi:hypothetical protein